MKPNIKIITICAAAFLLFTAIVFARYIFSEIDRLKTGDAIAPLPDQSTSTADISTSTPPVDSEDPDKLTQQVCEAAGGRWNSCGSLCRTEPPGTICAEVCVEYCECGDIQQYKCPAGYVCNDLVKKADSSAEIGICKKSSTEAQNTEYKSSDGVTTFILPDGANLSNPFTFYGTGTAFENNINWRLEDENGVKISEGFTTASSSDIGKPGSFTVTGFFDLVPATETGKLLVFESSAKDGSRLHVAEAQVSFPTSTETVTVFFNNTKEDPNLLDCSKVYPVERMVVQGNNVQLAVHELLKGALPTEKSAGFVSNLPSGINEPQITETGSAVRLDFNEDLQFQVGGSCRVIAIRSQIEETAKKASGKSEAIISINGRTNDILQP